MTGPITTLRGSTATELLAEVATARNSRLIAAVSGAGGSGKTVLLHDIEAEFRAVGVPVHRPDRNIEHLDFAAGAMLVDDAHDLNEAALTRIHSLVGREDLNLVVAYRPWPHPPALRRLAGALEQHRPAVVLGPLSRMEIANAAAAVIGAAPAPALVDQVWNQTGGMPWLVHRMLRTLQDEGAEPGAESHMLRRIMQRLGFELSELEPELHELLLAIAVGFDLSEHVPAALRFDERHIDELVAEAQGKGLLLPGGEVVPVVQRALLETTPAYHVRSFQVALVDTMQQKRRSLEPVARRLAQDGLQDSRIAESLVRSADHVLASQPELASVLYDEAQAAGMDGRSIAARRAQAAAASGELGRAGQILDDLFESDEVPDVRRAVDTFAAVWAQRGMLAHSAETYRWLGAEKVRASAPLAAIAMIGTGDREGAERMLSSAPVAGTPTLPSVAVRLMGEGVRASIDGSASGALPTLIRASDIMTAAGVALPLPDSPAALAALVALRSGELAVAGSVLDAALKGEQCGPAARPRLLLLRAWVAMQEDRPDQARTAIVAATAAAGELFPRDELFLRALEVGLARRGDDAPALVRAWRRARESILHVPVDLFDLLPLEELVVAAARMRESHRLESHLTEAWALLRRLGDPPLWAVPLHWASVQAAILTDRPGDLAPHAAALVRASSESRTASVLAAAGRAWVTVLGGKFVPATVEAAARGLALVGLTWDGSRLAGHAAAHAEDRRDVARLLACARDLHPGSKRPDSGQDSTEPAEAAVESITGDAVLSRREREVARLILDGKNYREIGEAIFISPRTVEHHIARIRSRFDVKSRSELLDQLRLALGDETA
ncbi:LuxR C-terminal-related transcriptional regulator [Lysobacter korlensis]|uniref:LuxR C-terminal-related transcriptional regulator n=1 Tax=Lysobacter korlensis TaxID=553636 RepID=A0ABV6RMR4_9GAMM